MLRSLVRFQLAPPIISPVPSQRDYFSHRLISVVPRSRAPIRSHWSSRRVQLGQKDFVAVGEELPVSGQRTQPPPLNTWIGLGRHSLAPCWRGWWARRRRLHRVEQLLPAAMHGIQMQGEISTLTEVGEARRGLTDAITAYLTM